MAFLERKPHSCIDVKVPDESLKIATKRPFWASDFTNARTYTRRKAYEAKGEHHYECNYFTRDYRTCCARTRTNYVRFVHSRTQSH